MSAALVSAEQAHALKRAQSLWGDGAFVMDQSDLNRKMFIVSSGKEFKPHAYGEGESWDEAFAAAGSTLFQEKVLKVMSDMRAAQAAAKAGKKPAYSLTIELRVETEDPIDSNQCFEEVKASSVYQYLKEYAESVGVSLRIACPSDKRPWRLGR